ncbi:hypothetical protein P170DRAFT_451896 [Aspergillus steynii IBT 23096]|uniref:Uncharacterized protein n=1 Tax=Aspergillus steynii IBT 23096 TaxID=1392250 RepID=A0A2I2GMB9_9EURO|nr:uncharacterized protein P170DRAFT_451896 [Aspergillus steynii IBT 23096]PLB54010.1 hypothetical protein P170DRAFT_451896 [Aspergillus steynii IBT 23096]
MESSYFDTITSKPAFNTHCRDGRQKDFLDLNLVAASEWGRDHLFACRLIRRAPQRLVLPILAPYTRPSDLKSSTEIISFVNGPPGPRYMAQSEHQLVRRSGCGISLGQIWAALAMFKGSRERREKKSPPDNDDGSDEGEKRAKRPRQNTPQKDFVDSRNIRVGSSSPETESSQEASSVASPEDETLRLASCVIRHILYFGAPQDRTELPTVVEFRDAKVRLVAEAPISKRKIVAIDDGGLCLRKESNGGFVLSKNHLAILEGKRQFQSFENGRPIVSDKCLAQMTCEALVAGIDNTLYGIQPPGVIVINVTQHYMCPLHFEITSDYLNDLESLSPTSFLYLDSTPWFDLDSTYGRKQVVSNLCGLMRRELQP